MEKLELLCTVGRNVKWCSCYGKEHDDSLKIKNRITVWPNNLQYELKAGSQRYIWTPALIAVLFLLAKRWKQSNRWMHKKNVGYVYNRILSLKKKGILTWMILEDMLSEISHKINMVWFYLHELLRQVKYIETK